MTMGPSTLALLGLSYQLSISIDPLSISKIMIKKASLGNPKRGASDVVAGHARAKADVALEQVDPCLRGPTDADHLPEK